MFDEETTFLGKLKASMKKKKPTIVFFTWSRCGPCKIVQRVLEELKIKNKPPFKANQMFTVDLEDEAIRQDQFFATYGVGTTPQVVAFSKDKEIGRVIGVQGNTELGVKEALLAINK